MAHSVMSTCEGDTVWHTSGIAYLADVLDDTEWRVPWSVVQALPRLTGEGLFPARYYFQEKEADFSHFWKDWAANHPDQVKKE